MKKNIGDLVVRLRKNNQERLQKLSTKKEISYDKPRPFKKRWGTFVEKDS